MEKGKENLLMILLFNLTLRMSEEESFCFSLSQENSKAFFRKWFSIFKKRERDVMLITLTLQGNSAEVFFASFLMEKKIFKEWAQRDAMTWHFWQISNQKWMIFLSRKVPKSKNMGADIFE